MAQNPYPEPVNNPSEALLTEGNANTVENKKKTAENTYNSAANKPDGNSVDAFLSAWIEEREKEYSAANPPVVKGRKEQGTTTAAPPPSSPSKAPQQGGGLSQAELERVTKEAEAWNQPAPAGVHGITPSGNVVVNNPDSSVDVFDKSTHRRYHYDVYEDYTRGKVASVSGGGASQREFDPNRDLYIVNGWGGPGDALIVTGETSKALGLDRGDEANRYAHAAVSYPDDFESYSDSQLRAVINELSGEGFKKDPSMMEINAKRLVNARAELAARMHGYAHASNAMSDIGNYEFKRLGQSIATQYPSDLSKYLMPGAPELSYSQVMALNPLNDLITNADPSTIAAIGGNDGENNIIRAINNQLMDKNSNIANRYANWALLYARATNDWYSTAYGKALRNYTGNLYDEREANRNQYIEDFARGYMGGIESKIGKFGAAAVVGVDDSAMANLITGMVRETGRVTGLYHYGESDFLKDVRFRANKNFRDNNGFWLGTATPIGFQVGVDYYMMKGAGKVAQVTGGRMLSWLGQGAKALGGGAEGALAASEVMQSGGGKAILTALNFGFYNVGNMAAHDFGEGHFSGVLPYLEALGEAPISALGLGAANRLVRPLIMAPTNIYKAASNRVTLTTAELFGFSVPTWVKDAYGGEIGKDGYFKASLASNVAMIGSYKIAGMVEGDSPLTRKTSDSTIQELREKGYGKLADELESRNEWYLKLSGGEHPLELSEEGWKSYRQLQEDMNVGGKGVSWQTYAELNGTMGVGTLPPGPSDARVVERNGEYKVMLVDSDGRAIGAVSTHTKMADAEAARKELAKDLSVVVEGRDRITYDSEMEQYVYGESCRAMADSRNEGKQPYNEQGNLRPDYNGVTANQMAEEIFIAYMTPEGKRTPEQIELLDEYSRVSESVLEGVQGSMDVKKLVCEQYGVPEEEFDKMLEKKPESRGDGKTAQAVQAFNEIMAKGFQANNGVPQGTVVVADQSAPGGKRTIVVYNKIDLKEDGTPANRGDVVYYKDRNNNLVALSAEDIITAEYSPSGGWKVDADVEARRAQLVDKIVAEYSILAEDQLREKYKETVSSLESGTLSQEERAKLMIAKTAMEGAANEKGYRLEDSKTDRELAAEYVENNFSGSYLDKDGMVQYLIEHPAKLLYLLHC